MAAKANAAALLMLFACGVGGGESPVHWQERILVASGDAQRGPWRMNRSEFDYVDDATVAVGSDGIATVAWVDQARKDVFVQRYAPDGHALLRQPVNVSRSSDIFSWLPRVVVSDGDPAAVYLLWQEIIFSGGSHGGDILFARSLDGGRTFEAPINLSSDRAGSGKGRLTEEHWHNGSLDLARAEDGRLYAAWTDYEGSLWLSRSADRGKSFAEPLQIVSAGSSPPARSPSLGMGPRGTVYLAWSVGGQIKADIRLVRSTDGGLTFTGPRIARVTNGRSDAPELIVDSEGSLHLFYAEHVQGSSGDGHVAYTHGDPGEETFSEPIRVSQPQSSRFHGAAFPSADADGHGRLYVLWELFPEAGGAPRGLGYTLSDDGGTSWAPPRVIPGSLDPDQGINGSLQGLLMRKLAVNARGDIAVVNSTFLRGEQSRVWLLQGRRAVEGRTQDTGASWGGGSFRFSLPTLAAYLVGLPDHHLDGHCGRFRRHRSVSPYDADPGQ